MAYSLVGAWELVDDPDWRELQIFTEAHYCILEVRKDRKSFKGDQPSEAEQAEAYRSMGAGGGTYTLSGSTLALSENLNRDPIGTSKVCEIIWIDDDSLKFNWGVQSEEYAYRRIS